ncbi:MAG: acetate--CoA ligase family protein [Gemmatimonadetes bacterium]|nr:acetate--CoA ligase family protein [Gemmatimonadota bacterium]
MRVLVLDGNENQAVASVRSIGRAGHAVEVGAPSAWSKAGWSRFASRSFRYPGVQEDAAGFVDAIVAQLRAGPAPALVLPMTERTTLPLSVARERVEAAGGRLVIPPHATLLRAFDKNETTRIAASVGVTVPQTRTAASPADARAAAATLTYPVVLKPVSSEELDAHGRMQATGAPVYARTPAELEPAIAAIFSRAPAIVLQEFIEGTGAGYFALMNQGQLRLEFGHRRIRDVRPTGSGSAVRESAALDPRVRDAGRKVLEALGWHGVAMVEFRIRPDGTPVFLEVNGRFWNSLALAVVAGADFPRLLAEIAERGDCETIPGYRVGVRCRWFLGDARHLAEVMRGRPAGFPGPFPARLPTLLEFLRPVPGTFHDNFTLDDPLPELGDWADFLFRRVPGRRS